MLHRLENYDEGQKDIRIDVAFLREDDLNIVKRKRERGEAASNLLNCFLFLASWNRARSGIESLSFNHEKRFYLPSFSLLPLSASESNALIPVYVLVNISREQKLRIFVSLIPTRKQNFYDRQRPEYEEKIIEYK